MRTIQDFQIRVSELIAEFWAEGHDGRDLVDAAIDQCIIEGAAEDDNRVLTRACDRHE